MVAPWTPPVNPDYQLVKIPEVPVVQADFQGRSGGAKEFGKNDCTLIGSNDTLIAAELCLAPTRSGSLRTGTYSQQKPMPAIYLAVPVDQPLEL